MRIIKDNTVAVVIDIQERLFPHMFNKSQLETNVQILLDGLDILGMPFLLTEQYSKGLGSTIPSIQSRLEENRPIEKLTSSCCGENRFITELNKINKKNVILVGIEAHVCVLQTVLDLVEFGFQPVLVEDCVSSRRENDKLIAIERIRKSGAIVTTYESILLELCQVAGSEKFKQISKLIK